MTKELQIIFDNHFKFLTDEHGYTVYSSHFDSKEFGNFIIQLSKGDKKIKVISDRSQIFVYIFVVKQGWVDKEDFLENKGIKRTRFGITDGLWDGYQIQNQVRDINENKELLEI